MIYKMFQIIMINQIRSNNLIKIILTKLLKIIIMKKLNLIVKELKNLYCHT